jgi:hypothetical protein
MQGSLLVSAGQDHRLAGVHAKDRRLQKHEGIGDFKLVVKVQSYMTFMAVNLKRVVWLLTGGRLPAI